jgi:hypothetical protein
MVKTKICYVLGLLRWMWIALTHMKRSRVMRTRGGLHRRDGYEYKDVEAMEDGSILLTLFNGGIRNDENEHIISFCLNRRSVSSVRAPARIYPGLAI